MERYRPAVLRRRWTPEEDALVMDLHGEPDQVIARRLQRTPKAVNLRRRRLRHGPVLTYPQPVDEQLVVDMARKHASLRKIAGDLDISVHRVRSILGRHGMSPILIPLTQDASVRVLPRTLELQTIIGDLANQGMSAAMMGRRLGLSQSYCSRIQRRLAKYCAPHSPA